MEGSGLRVGGVLRPAAELRTRYYIDLLIAVAILILPWYVPVLIFYPIIVKVAVSIPIAALIAFIAYWIEGYCRSMTYEFSEAEITWRRGIWFKKTSIVPYSRITNIDVEQGPISRILGIASLRIQTAGYSARRPRAELRIEGVKDYEGVRSFILEQIERGKPAAVEVLEEEDVGSRILSELTRIREILEKLLERAS